MYTSFFQLKEEPFLLTPDPRFLHLAEPHRAAITTLIQGIVLRKGFVTLTGPVGTGKTTILHAALNILTDQACANTQVASAFLVNPTLSRDEFLEALLDEFEVVCPSPSKHRRLVALHQMLLETQRRGGTAVVFVDEAHLLSLELLEEIRLLSNADSYREKLLQIILCGQPELTAILHRPEMNALQQRIGASCALRALSLAETRAYVAERLHAAGMRGPNPFSGPALENIHRYTKGVPRLINLVCLNCLMIAHAGGRHLVEPDIVEEASVQLGLVEMPAWGPTKATPVPELPEGTLLHTSVDVMIESMRKSRAAARG